METISPIVSEAFQLLHLDLYSHLDEVENLADRCDGWSDDDAWTARELLEDLVQVVRTVLGAHRAQDSGTCRTCAFAWPCPVVTAIHNELKRPEHHFVELLDRANQTRWAQHR